MSEDRQHLPEAVVQERKSLAEQYKERLSRANPPERLSNCAGLTKFILGLAETDGFIRTGDSSEKGLIKYLEMVHRLDLSDFSDDEWRRLSLDTDAAGVLHRFPDDRWQILHFFVPNPDPESPFEVFHRNGFDEVKAEIGDIREVIKDEEYSSDDMLIFFKKKEIS